MQYNKLSLRKWYGNNELVVNWENAGSAIRNLSDFKTGRIRSHNYNGEYVKTSLSLFRPKSFIASSDNQYAIEPFGIF